MDGEEWEPMEAFETWLLRRVAQAVEAGEVRAHLLAELQTEFGAAKEGPQEAARAVAIRQVAEIADIDEAKATEILASIEVQPAVTRELLLRRIAEAWLEAQRTAYRRQRNSQHG